MRYKLGIIWHLFIKGLYDCIHNFFFGLFTIQIIVSIRFKGIVDIFLLKYRRQNFQPTCILFSLKNSSIVFALNFRIWISVFVFSENAIFRSIFKLTYYNLRSIPWIGTFYICTARIEILYSIFQIWQINPFITECVFSKFRLCKIKMIL